MCRHVFRLCLILAACLGTTALATAKPPDLPIDSQVTCGPQVTVPVEVGKCGAVQDGAILLLVQMKSFLLPDWVPPVQTVGTQTDCGAYTATEYVPCRQSLVIKTPQQLARPKMSMATRRNLAACLLFGCHPFFMLVPTEPLVETPADHPNPNQPICFSGFVEISEEPCDNHGTDIIGGNCRADYRVNNAKATLLNSNWLIAQIQAALCGRMLDYAAFEEEIETQTPVVYPSFELSGGERLCDSTDASETADNSDGSCPWPRMQKCQRIQIWNGPTESQMPADVLTNLQKITDAEDLFQLAEKLRQHGHISQAANCYKMADSLCPGSRIGAMASNAMVQMLQPFHAGLTFCSEEEQTVGPCQAGICVQVDCIMKACRLAVEAGCYQKAAELAGQAHAMAPKLVAADPLVYKMHLVDCAMQKGCLIGAGAACGVATAHCGHGSVMGAAFSGCLHCVAERCPCCPCSCGSCECCPACCSKPCCDKCKTECDQVKKNTCAGKGQGCQSCGSCCSPCCTKACAASCPTAPACGKKSDCAAGCQDQGTHCPASTHISTCPAHGGCPATSTCPGADGENSTRLRPALPAVDPTVVKALEEVQTEAEQKETDEELTVVEEDRSPKNEITVAFGLDLWPAQIDLCDWLGLDVKSTAEELKLLWQFKFGPWLCQVRYGKPGLDVDVQPMQDGNED
jgi:hypothetical protein